MSALAIDNLDAFFSLVLVFPIFSVNWLLIGAGISASTNAMVSLNFCNFVLNKNSLASTIFSKL